MRQTLLRIRLDRYFDTGPLDGVTTIGIGWLALVVVPILAFWVLRHVSDLRKRDPDALAMCGIGLVAALVSLTAPLWASRLPYHREHGFAFVPVYGYGFMLFVGFLSAAWWAGTRARAVRLPTEVVWDSCMWLFFGGIAGARLFYLIQYRHVVFKDKSGIELVTTALNLPDGGLVLYGGVILGTAAFTLHCWRRGLDGLLIADVLVPSFFVGLGFGRVGCFLNGCCYGNACSLPWAVRFPRGTVPFEALAMRGVVLPDAAATFPIHPTQLYSALNAFLIAGLLHAYFRYRPRHGSVLALAMLTYPVTRFVLEILRSDESGQFGTSLTISQWVSIGLFATGLLFQGWLSWRGRHAVRPPRAMPTA